MAMMTDLAWLSQLIVYVDENYIIVIKLITAKSWYPFNIWNIPLGTIYHTTTEGSLKFIDV